MDFQLFYHSLTPKKVFAILFAVGFIVYMDSFVNGLFWDDYDSIVNNQYIRSFDHLPYYFTRNLTAGAGITDNYWRPLLLVSFATDYAVGGLEPFFYHFQNFAWHLAASILVFLVGIKLFRNKTAGLVAALLFLVHPLQTEAVTYAAGRADPMHTALMLGSIYLLFRHIESKKYQSLAWSLVLFILSLLAKERAVVLPVILALSLFLVPLDGYIRTWKQKLLLLSPYVAIAGLYAMARMTVLHFADTFDPGVTTILQGTTPWEKALVFLAGIGTYAKLIVWPDRLYMEKSLPLPDSILDPMVIFGAVILALSAFLIFSSFKRKKLITFCFLAFFATLLPSMYVYPVQGLLYEHWLYPAFPWLFLGIGIGSSAYLDGTKRLRKISPVLRASITCVVIVAFGIRTIVRNSDWQNPIRFYEKNVALGGVSARVYTNLGMAYDDAHLPGKAILTYRDAIELSGNTLFQPWFDMGNTLTQQKRTDEALDAYRHSIEINPRFIAASLNSAKIYADRKDFGAAINILKNAEGSNPNQPSLLSAIAIISVNAGDFGTAETYANRILTPDPHNPEAEQIISFIRSRR